MRKKITLQARSIGKTDIAPRYNWLDETPPAPSPAAIALLAGLDPYRQQLQAIMQVDLSEPVSCAHIGVDYGTEPPTVVVRQIPASELYKAKP